MASFAMDQRVLLIDDDAELCGLVTRFMAEEGFAVDAATNGRQGVMRDTLKPGDRVIVVSQPGRVPEEHRLRMVNLTRPIDGWKWGGTFD